MLEISEADWVCLICGHNFDAASDADKFFCGEPCIHVLTPMLKPAIEEHIVLGEN